MNEIIQRWLKDIEGGNLNDDNVERALRYARDLEHGLAKLQTFAQGVTVFGSARLPESSKWYKLAHQLGRRLAEEGHGVITGGGPSIMEAANRGSYEVGGRSIGLNITLPHEQQPNPYLTDHLEFRYFFARKVMLTFSSKVYVFFPGGFGTMDELTEVLILMQEGKMPVMPVFLVGKSFWTPLDKFYKNKLEKMALIKPKDRKLYKITDDIEVIVQAAEKIGHPSIHDNLYQNFGKDKGAI
jgi:uncharacterized protein (TIGR00730 family)